IESHCQQRRLYVIQWQFIESASTAHHRQAEQTEHGEEPDDAGFHPNPHDRVMGNVFAPLKVDVRQRNQHGELLTEADSREWMLMDGESDVSILENTIVVRALVPIAR